MKTRVFLVVLVGQLVIHAWVGYVMGQTPQQDIVNVQNQARLENLDQRLARLEHSHITENVSVRLAVVESQLSEIRLLSRGVTVAVVGLLAESLMAFRQRRTRDA